MIAWILRKLFGVRYELVTDGQKYAVKKTMLGTSLYLVLDSYEGIYWSTKEEKWFGNAWLEKAKAEMWLRRYTA